MTKSQCMHECDSGGPKTLARTVTMPSNKKKVVGDALTRRRTHLLSGCSRSLDRLPRRSTQSESRKCLLRSRTQRPEAARRKRTSVQREASGAELAFARTYVAGPQAGLRDKTGPIRRRAACTIHCPLASRIPTPTTRFCTNRPRLGETVPTQPDRTLTRTPCPRVHARPEDGRAGSRKCGVGAWHSNQNKKCAVQRPATLSACLSNCKVSLTPLCHKE